MAQIQDQFASGSVGVRLPAIAKNADGTVRPINDATSLTLVIERPGGLAPLVYTETPPTGLTNPGFETDGTDGLMKYDTIAGDLDAIGVHRWQLTIEGPGYKYPSRLGAFNVFASLPTS